MNDLSQKRLIHDQAQDLLDKEGLFMRAVGLLEARWRNELMASKTRAEQDVLVSNLKALDAIPTLLQTAINDFKFAQNRELKRSHV